jgi:hypothetical protein
VYRHRVVVAVDEMVGEMMRLLIPVFKIWMARGVRPTDAALHSLPSWIEFVPATVLSSEAREQTIKLWNRLRSRQHYRSVRVRSPERGAVSVRLSLSALDVDPVEEVPFYGPTGVHRMRIRDVTELLAPAPRKPSETRYYKLGE